MNKNLLQPMDPLWSTLPKVTKKGPLIATNSWKLRYLLEIFSICSSQVCKNLTKTFLTIAQSACQPQPILAETLDASTDCVYWDISKEKIWWGSRPIWITSWMECPISLEKWHFEFFWTSKGSTFTMSTNNHTKLDRN